MGFVRVYTGNDGQSHFEDLDLLPADVERSVAQGATNITFGPSPDGSFHDFHNAPRRQYAIFMSGGQMEVVERALMMACVWNTPTLRPVGLL